MSSSPVPLDVLTLIKAQIDPTLLGPHLLLSNLSHSVRDFLYPNDRTWRKLLNAAGIGRSQFDLEGKQVTRWWRDIAVEVSKHEREGSCVLCSSPFSGEGFLEHGEEIPIDMCARVRELNLKSSKLPVVVYSSEQVRDLSLRIKAHEKLGDIDCGRFDGDFLACLSEYRFDGPKTSFLCSSHPVLAHSFATVPPVSVMSLQGAVARNPGGVTHWDVRIALDKAYPYLTHQEFKQHVGRTYVRSMLDLAYDDAEELKKRKLVRTSHLWFNAERIWVGSIYSNGKGSVEFEMGSDS